MLLRWKMELRGLARARERAVGLLLALPGLFIFAAFGTLLTFVGIRGLDSAQPDALLPLLSAVATAVGVLSSMAPLLSGLALTETYDLSRLLLFPVPLTTLAASTLLANLLQPLVLAETPILLAFASATASGWASLPLTLFGGTLSFVFMLLVTQAVGLIFHGFARRRRFRDLLLFFGLGFGLLTSLAPLALVVGGGRVVGALSRFVIATDLFALSPFAWGVRAAVHAGRGDFGAFGVSAAAGAGAIGAALAVSAALIHRLYRGEMELGPADSSARSRSRMLLPGTLGAMIEKDLRSGWRDPAFKATLVMGLVGPLAFLFVLTQVGMARGAGRSLLLLASFVGLGGFGANALGLERRGIALLMSFPVERWRLLLAKNLFALLLRLPSLVMLLVAGFVLAPVVDLPAALTVSFVTFLVLAGVDNYVSVFFPVAAPAPGANPYGASSGGRGLGTAALTALFLGFGLLVASPFVFLAWLPLLLGNDGLWLVSLPVALAGAAAVYAMLLLGAGNLLTRREGLVMERILVES